MQTALAPLITNTVKSNLGDQNAIVIALEAMDYGALRKHCARLTSSPEQADDLLQDTTMRVLERPPKDLSRPLLPWCKQVAKNLWIDRCRRPQTRAEVSIEPFIENTASQRPDSPEAHDALQGVLSNALVNLSAKQLSIFLLHGMLEQDANAVAKYLDISPGNVRVSLHRVRSQLKGQTSTAAAAEFLHLVCSSQLGNLRDFLHNLLPNKNLDEADLTTRASLLVWQQLIRAAGASLATDDRLSAAEALWSQAAIARTQGRLKEVQRLLSQALSLAKSSGSTNAVSQILKELCMNSMSTGSHKTTYATYPEANNEWTTAGTLWRKGDYQAAEEIYQQQLNNPTTVRSRAAALHNLAHLDAFNGRLEKALSRGQEALSLHRSRHDVFAQAKTLNVMGMACQNVGAYAQANDYFQQSLLLFNDLDNLSGRAQVENNLGLSSFDRHELSTAQLHFHRAYDLSTEAGATRSQAISLTNLGVLHHHNGRLLTARRTLSQARALAERVNASHLRCFIDVHRMGLGEPNTVNPSEVESFNDAQLLYLYELFTALEQMNLQKLNELMRTATTSNNQLPLDRQSISIRIAIKVARRRAVEAVTTL